VNSDLGNAGSGGLAIGPIESCAPIPPAPAPVVLTPRFTG
jgi:hypothetical protein